MSAKRKVFMISGILVIILCVSLILFSASEFVDPYYSVSEVASDATSFMGQRIQMIGKVVNGSTRTVGGDITFKITDGQSALNVIYSGSTPQNFKEGIDVVVIGNLISTDTFKANEILTKCPSKYQ